jgi:hypothetical protein
MTKIPSNRRTSNALGLHANTVSLFYSDFNLAQQSHRTSHPYKSKAALWQLRNAFSLYRPIQIVHAPYLNRATSRGNRKAQFGTFHTLANSKYCPGVCSVV